MKSLQHLTRPFIRLMEYETPKALSYCWNFGSLALLGLGIQVVTGLILAMWYVPSIDYAFDSINFIMREVYYGWLVRYLHVNGASFFFFCSILSHGSFIVL